MRVLVMEPANQLMPQDTARPNGALGPAYLVAALRAAGVEADYYDATVGWEGESLTSTFYNRYELEHQMVRYGASKEADRRSRESLRCGGNQQHIYSPDTHALRGG